VATTFSALSAGERAAALLDRGTFVPLTDITARAPLLAGSGVLAGEPVWLALTDGHVRGGTIGVREASALARVAETVAARHGRRPRPAALIIGFDTGGVRVEEGPRALAAAAGAGVALARLTLLGVRLAAVISGPRGCFGAPAVMASLPEHIIMTAGARWGLTGPKLLANLSDRSLPESTADVATSAVTKLGNGDAHAVVEDTAESVRAQLLGFVGATPGGGSVTSLAERIAASAQVAADLERRFTAARARVAMPPSGPAVKVRRRDLLRYSFRGQWKPSASMVRRGLVQAALGTLGGRPALGFVIGPEPARGAGVGIEEAAVVTDMLHRLTHGGGTVQAPILTFLFCQGHAVDLTQERFGLQRALAECLRAMVAVRMRGHPIVSVLGGGTYGAAYLALAAPSHRILAMRGTSIAPMAPAVLRAFQALRARAAAPEAPMPLAELIPDIRIVDSVIRLPRVLREELTCLLDAVPGDDSAAE
jgi:malonate decarboxylase beta subunit